MKKLETAVSIGAGVIAAFAMLMLAPSVLAAEYYTWVDENGVTNYSERNPQGYSADHITAENRFGYKNPGRLDAPSGDESETAASEEPLTENAADEDVDKFIADERARIDMEIAKAKKSNCAIGKRNLAQLEAYSRIRVKDEDGTERVLTDAEKGNRMSQARQTIRENCTG
jgi:hypothetical protein